MAKEIDMKKLEKMLEDVKEDIKDGKFKLVLRGAQRIEILAFIEYLTESKKKKISKDEIELAKDILKAAKGYYYYGAQIREGEKKTFTAKFLSDLEYDKLLAVFKDLSDDDEPNPITPRSLQKIAPVDKDLVNKSMNRCYRLNADDSNPFGVEEKGSVEKIVKSIYEDAKLDKDDETTIMLDIKVDGVAVVAKIKDGEMKVATLKGEEKNEAVKVKGLKGLKLGNPKYDDCNVQYEAFITDQKREYFSDLLDTPYKHNRTTISGLINRLAQSDDEKLIKEITKNIYFYPIAATETDDDKLKDMYKNFNTMGILPSTGMIERRFFKGNRKDIIKAIDNFFKEIEAKRTSLNYTIDGIVVTFIDKDVKEKLGRKNGANMYQFAYKFKPFSEKVKVQTIYLSAGNLGKRTPMVRFEAVTIDGRRFTEAPINKISDLSDFALRVGDEAILTVVGDAIPKISKDDTCKEDGHGKRFVEFTKCPLCNQDLGGSENQYICENPSCSGNVVGRIANMMEKLNVPADQATAAVIYEKVNSIRLSDVLKIKFEDLADALGKKRARTIADALENSLKKLRDYELLGLMGIPGLQEKTAMKILANHTIKDIANMREDQLKTLIESLDGFAGTSAYKLARGIYYQSVDLLQMVKLINPQRPDYESMKMIGCTGMSFDSDLLDVIKDNNWGSTEGKKFDILITSSHSRDGKKMDIAKENKLPIYTREEFIEKYKK